MPSISELINNRQAAPGLALNYDLTRYAPPQIGALAQTQYQTPYPSTAVGQAGYVPINRIGPTRKPSAAQQAALAQIYALSGTSDPRLKGYTTGNRLFGSTYVDNRITPEQEELLDELQVESEFQKTQEIDIHNRTDQARAAQFEAMNQANRDKYPGGSAQWAAEAARGGAMAHSAPVGSIVRRQGPNNQNMARYAGGGQGNSVVGSGGVRRTGMSNSVNNFFDARFNGYTGPQPKFSTSGGTSAFGATKQTAIKGRK